MEKNDLFELLSQINGVYIPGDSKQSYLNEQFKYSIQSVLDWAQQHNSEKAQHFPVIAMGYGFAAMLESQMENG